jgi:DNA-binding LacI/PurR family transcriptional regulator
LPDGGFGGPRYRAVERDLAARIRRGDLPPGSLVPSEALLCAHYGVSVTTARRALLELARQGLIYRQAGVGTFVADPGRHKRLALVFAGFEGARWRATASSIGELVGGVSEVVWRHECALELIRVDEPLDAALLTRLMRQGGADGLLLRVAGNIREEHAALLEAASFPHVFVRRYLPGRPANAVVPADDAGMRLAVGHLARLGHRRIGLLDAVPDMVLTRDRVRGYRAAVRAHGLAQDEGLVALAGYYDAEPGYRFAKQLLSRPTRKRPTALVADAVLVPGIYRAAAERGLAIPADLAVVGYDDAPEARALLPRLTLIRSSHYEIGAVAAELLLDLILGRVRGPRQVFVEPVLEARASCGAQRGDAANVGDERDAGQAGGAPVGGAREGSREG